VTDYIGKTLGDYRILKPIGAGGMGQVYLAESIHHQKRYALKVLPDELSTDTGFRQRFFDEACVMSELNHAGIVRVHHIGEHQGTYYLVMDYVEGAERSPCSLHQELARTPDRRLDETTAWKYITQIAQALSYAHKQGVVHRDIKPANILLDQDGHLMITDFGLAKVIGSEFIAGQIHATMDTLSDQRTLVGDGPDKRALEDSLDFEATIDSGHRGSAPSKGSTGILGTYDYMSPEQREPGGSIDQRSDIYSLGVLIYRILTGKRPVGMTKPPSQVVEGLSFTWDTIVAKCLEDDPKDRYGAVDQLLFDLQKIGKGRSYSKAIAAAFILVVALALAGAYVGICRIGSGDANPSSEANRPSPPITHTDTEPVITASQNSKVDATETQKPEPSVLPVKADSLRDDIPGIVILPFHILGQDAGLDSDLGAQMSERLAERIDPSIYRLYGPTELKARMADGAYQMHDLIDKPSPAAQFSETIGCGYVVLGALARAGSKYCLSARLINVGLSQIANRISVTFHSPGQWQDQIDQLAVNLNVNKPTGGTPYVGNDLIDSISLDNRFVSIRTAQGKQTYHEGEYIKFIVSVERDCYVTLITVDSEDSMTLLLPNKWQQQPFLQRGTEITIPSDDMGFRFPIQPPHGITLVKAVATSRPLLLSGVNTKGIEEQGFVALTKGVKAIGVEGISPDPTSQTQEITGRLTELLEDQMWATDEMIVITSGQDAQGGAAAGSSDRATGK
jgi:serine/threonine protein kinase